MLMEKILCRQAIPLVSRGGDLLLTVYSLNIAFIILANLLLIVGVFRVRESRQHCPANLPRNTWLVVLLSCVDLLVAGIQLPLQIYFLRAPATDIGCPLLILRNFWVVFPLTLSGNLILLISIDRYTTVVSNHKICGRIFTNASLLACVFLCFAVAFMFGFWYSYIAIKYYAKHVQTAFFVSVAAYKIILLSLAVAINYRLLLATRTRVMSFSEPPTNVHDVNKTLTKTIMLISSSLVLSYLPAAVMELYIAYLMFGQRMLDLVDSFQVLIWLLVLCQLNSCFNAVIYTMRNRRIRHMYASLFSCRQQDTSS